MIPTVASSPASAWARFHATVIDDDARLAPLFATADASAFTAACLKLAADLGLPLTEADIAVAIAEARRARMLRHVA